MSPSHRSRDAQELVRLVKECGGGAIGAHVMMDDDALVRFAEAIQTRAAGRSNVAKGPFRPEGEVP